MSVSEGLKVIRTSYKLLVWMANLGSPPQLAGKEKTYSCVTPAREYYDL